MKQLSFVLIFVSLLSGSLSANTCRDLLSRNMHDGRPPFHDAIGRDLTTYLSSNDPNIRLMAILTIRHVSNLSNSQKIKLLVDAARNDWDGLITYKIGYFGRTVVNELLKMYDQESRKILLDLLKPEQPLIVGMPGSSHPENSAPGQWWKIYRETIILEVLHARAP